MRAYLHLLQTVLDEGSRRTDRTGTGTISRFGPQFDVDLHSGFPLLTTKRLHWKSIVHELLWMIAGDTNVKYLQDNGVHIWDEWADENGDLGPVYGAQWRSWPTLASQLNGAPPIDQLQDVIRQIKETPDSRRLMVSAWNVEMLPFMKLPPCHVLFQFYVEDGVLDLKLYQRSADLFLGVPFNIASYALLLTMVAHVCGLQPGRFIHTFGDAHIYVNHLDQVHTQLKREARRRPTMRIVETGGPVTDITQFRAHHFVLDGYDPHPSIKAPVAV